MNTTLMVKDMVKLYPFKSKIYRIKDVQTFYSLTVSVTYAPEYRGKLFFIELDNNGNNLLLFVHLKRDALHTERSILTQRLISTQAGNDPVCIRLYSELELEFELEIHCE